MCDRRLTERRGEMESIRFKPKVDGFYLWIFIPTLILLAVATVFAALEPMALFVIAPADLFTLYFLISPFFGYVELRESTVLVKVGFFIKREFPYRKIRGTVKERRFISESMLSLKCSMEHVNIKYNTFDVITVSVQDNDELISKIEERVSAEFRNNQC